MTTMTDSKALEMIRTGDWSIDVSEAFAHIAARLREPAGVDLEQFRGAVAAHHLSRRQRLRDLSAGKYPESYRPIFEDDLAEASRLLDVIDSAAAPQPPAEAQAQGGGEAISRSEAVWIAKAAAYARRDDHSYLPQTADVAHADWTPHNWVIDAIRTASMRTAPPSAPVGVEGLVSALQSMRDRMMAALPPKFGDAFDGDFDTLLEAINTFKAGRGQNLAALAQQPASDGGFTAADMMDARQEGRKEAQQPAAVDEEDAVTRMCEAYYGVQFSYTKGARDKMRRLLHAALAQHPAAVGEAVERLSVALSMYDQRRITMQSLAGAVGDFLDDYRAAQPGGSDNDR